MPGASIGVRHVERYARNPQCQRRGAMLAAGTTAAEVAEAAFGEDAGQRSQSPFAIRRGTAFGKCLLSERAARLLEAFGERLSPDARVADPSREVPTPEEQRAETLPLLRQMASGAGLKKAKSAFRLNPRAEHRERGSTFPNA